MDLQALLAKLAEVEFLYDRGEDLGDHIKEMHEMFALADHVRDAVASTRPPECDGIAAMPVADLLAILRPRLRDHYQDGVPCVGMLDVLARRAGQRDTLRAMMLRRVERQRDLDAAQIGEETDARRLWNFHVDLQHRAPRGSSMRAAIDAGEALVAVLQRNFDIVSRANERLVAQAKAGSAAS